MAKRLPSETFFMLTPNVRDRLLECKLTAAEWRMWCYLVSLDPFGDSGAKFSPAELMLKCGIKKTAYFKAKAKFQQLGLFDFKDGVTKVFNLQGHSAKTDYSQQATLIESANAESQSANAESQSANAESQSANADNESLKPLSDKDCETLQTLKIIQTLQTEGGENKSFINSDVLNNQENDSQTQELTSLDQILDQGFTYITKSTEQDKIPPVCNTDVEKQSTPSKPDSNNLTPELIAKLKDLNIPLDQAVRKAIASYHPSQIWSALQHIDDFREEIHNPRGIFLYQVPRQQKDERKDPKERFTREFCQWYAQAITDGLVVNRPLNELGLYQFIEPIVQLKNGEQWPWTQVRDGRAEIKKEIPFRLGMTINPEIIRENARKAREERLKFSENSQKGG